MTEPTSPFDFAAALDLGTPFGLGLKGLLIAALLGLVAAQPPYAIMIWRDVRRAWRRGHKSIAATAAGATAEVTTLDTAVLLVVIGIGVAIGLRPSLPLWVAVTLAALLLVLALIDFRYYWLPDRLTVPLGLAGLAAALPDVDMATEGALAAVLAGGAFYALHVGYRMLRGVDGLGLGDVKLVAALGAWVGIASLSWLVLTAALTALLAAGASALRSGKLGDGAIAPQARSPFGLHLALAGWVFICARQGSLWGG